MTTNIDRTLRAACALNFYVKTKGEVFENSVEEIADLMADLLHLAESKGETDRVRNLAELHFKAEQADPEEQ